MFVIYGIYNVYLLLYASFSKLTFAMMKLDEEDGSSVQAMLGKSLFIHWIQLNKGHPDWFMKTAAVVDDRGGTGQNTCVCSKKEGINNS